MSDTNLSYNFMLFGKKGSGKSATGNTLLGQMRFKTSNSSKSSAQDVVLESGQFENYQLNVVDTPGIHDTKTDMSATLEMIYNGVSLIPDGLNAFLLVLRIGDRSTKELNETIKAFKVSFGETIAKDYCIIVYTFGDAFDEPNNDDVEAWCRKEENIETGSDLDQLMKECNYKVVVFSNRDEGKRDECVNKFLSFLKPQSGRYTSETFKQCADARDEYVTSMGFLEQRSEFQKELSLLITKLDDILHKNGDKNVADILKQAESLNKRIEEASAGTKEMADFKLNLQEIIQKIKGLDKRSKNFMKQTEDLRRKVHLMKSYRYVASALAVALVAGGCGVATATGLFAVPVVAGAVAATALFAGGAGALGYQVYTLKKNHDAEAELALLESTQSVESTQLLESKAQDKTEIDKKKYQ